LATAASSKVHELPVFRQLWLELDEFWGSNQEEKLSSNNTKAENWQPFSKMALTAITKALSCC
jgi:hypothetical protein